MKLRQAIGATTDLVEEPRCDPLGPPARLGDGDVA